MSRLRTATVRVAESYLFSNSTCPFDSVPLIVKVPLVSLPDSRTLPDEIEKLSTTTYVWSVPCFFSEYKKEE